MTAVAKMSDKTGYDEYYKGREQKYPGDEAFCRTSLLAYSKGGSNPRGYARGLATSMLLARAKPGDTVLDAGCGLGNTSIYLANQGLNVVGVEISEEGCAVARRKAAAAGASVEFLAESLEQTSIPDRSVDHIVGYGSLHHFIKYNVPPEFKRILKPGGEGFFADSFGENKLFQLFHDKAKMERLGDVNLTRQMLREYFADFELEIIPTDWFAMLDKLYQKFLPQPIVRTLAKAHYFLDRKLPLPLGLAGVIVTHIKLSES
jgi:ubiquinone/menaquinone biosynthesis C-methylase UbiE